jgi:chromosome segregation protein
MLLGFDQIELAEEGRLAQDERRREIERLKVRLEEFGIAGGQDILNEFRETSERDAFLEKELSDLNNSSQSLLGMIAELNEKLLSEFKEGVSKVNDAFNNFFRLMFDGGSAKLEIENPKSQARNPKQTEEDIDEILNEENQEKPEDGIEISVSLPKKRVKGLEMLSGGERALTSIALLFAISQVNPPPFIILDETDAALDEANSKKYGDMIESLSKFSQLILITHNRETMSRAGVIYGVTMTGSGISRLLSIAFDDALSVAK